MKQLIQAQLALAIVFGLGSMQAQAAEPRGPQVQSAQAPFSAVQDWSSRSIIQSKPMFPDEMERAGKTSEMKRLYSDPRYLTAVMRRVESELPSSAQIQRRNSAPMATQGLRFQDPRRKPNPAYQPEESIHRDWSNVLGGGTDGQGGRAAPGVFPAKYNFDIFATPSCSDDFIVYTTNAGGATQSGAAQEQWSGSFSNTTPSQGQIVTVGLAGPRRVVLVASTSSNTGLNFQVGGTTDANARAQNLRDAVNRWAGQTGFSASGTNATVTIVSNTAGDINNGSVSTNMSAITLTRSLPGGATTGGQPTVVAFNQLYNTTCNAGHVNPGQSTGARTNDNAPNVTWSYNTGAGYITETSPVLSFSDTVSKSGKQVAFVQRNGNTLQLVLLKWKNGQGTAAAPATPALSVSAAAYRACLDDCYYVIPFSTQSGVNNSAAGGPTYSSPFVDYPGDILWVGDGNGILHKFENVFNGPTPKEVTTGGFPKVVELGMKLSSPVFDYNSSVYVGSQSGAGTTGGKLYRIDAGSGITLSTSAKLALASTTGMRESALIDLRSQSVYAFIFNDDTTNYTDTAHCQAFNGEIDGCRAIFRFATNFANGTSGTRQWIGRGNSVTRTLYAGGFDDEFYNSANGTGNMYITGGRANNTFYATAWKVPINAGALGSPIAGPEFGARDRYTGADNAANDNLQNLSPATVILNPNTGFEYLYVSTASHGNATGCGDGTYAGGACLYMYALNQSVTESDKKETWTFRIERTGNFGSYDYNGIPSSVGGSISVNGTVLTAGSNNTGSNFSASGNRSDDRDALVAKIDALSGYSAAVSGGCATTGNFASGACDFIVTRDAFGNVASGLVTESLTNVSPGVNTDGAIAGTSIQPIAWGTGITPAAALPVTAGNGAAPATQVPGGTGGIVIDNVRPTSEPGTSQIYFTQGGTTGNAIQASQSGLQ